MKIGEFCVKMFTINIAVYFYLLPFFIRQLTMQAVQMAKEFEVMVCVRST